MARKTTGEINKPTGELPNPSYPVLQEKFRCETGRGNILKPTISRPGRQGGSGPDGGRRKKPDDFFKKEKDCRREKNWKNLPCRGKSRNGFAG